MDDAHPFTRAIRKEMRFAWLPKKLGDGRWIWLRSYWIHVPFLIEE